jgi:hypothetical protein
LKRKAKARKMQEQRSKVFFGNIKEKSTKTSGSYKKGVLGVSHSLLLCPFFVLSLKQ